MNTATNIQENAEDILAEAKEINRQRAEAENVVFEDESEDAETAAEETAEEE